MDPTQLQSPEDMLDRWSRVEDKCDPSVGWLCECCHDTQVVRNLLKERDDLRAELAEMTQEAFCEGASYCSDEDDARYGWWDTCARSSIKYMGDRLVELGSWERDPDGYGRRWFYRPVTPSPEDDDE